MICKNFSQISESFIKYPIKCVVQIFFFILGLGGLIFGILVKSGVYDLESGINSLSVSVIVVAALIVSCLMAIISFYFVFMDILTDYRRKVEKVYQRKKRAQKKSIDSVSVINLE